MSSGNSILLFRVCFLLFEIRGNQFQQKNISLLMKQSSSIFLSEEADFLYRGDVFFDECFVPGIGN